MKIYSTVLNLHDHNTYDGSFHNQLERYTRFKHNVPWHFDAYEHHSEGDKMNINDYRLNVDFYNNFFYKRKNSVLAFTFTKGGIRGLLDDNYLKKYSNSLKYNSSLDTIFLKDKNKILHFKPKNLWDYFYNNDLYYIDHHQSHATYAYLNSDFKESDILAIDGIGWNFRCIFVEKNGKIIDLSKELPLGWIWNQMSKLTGFGSLGASKLMGLVGYGKYDEYYYNVFNMLIDDERREDGNKDHVKILNYYNHNVSNLAYTLQKFTLDKIKEYVYPLKSCNNLCVAGGVAYNGYMNEEFTKQYKNVFVPPAVGDEGQAIGVYQHADYMLNKNIHKSKTFAGREYEFKGDEKVDYKEVAQAIADGKIVGWFQGKSESGNRALGNRSILADPRNPDIKDIINHTIKMREDFRPFAPAVLEEHYKEYFDTRLPSPYMSRICKVKSDKVPGITHIDNTARIQTVNKEFNEKFYNVINEFYKLTGVPMLLNTSFNCQEPIVEYYVEAVRTFKRTYLDILVIENYILRK